MQTTKTDPSPRHHLPLALMALMVAIVPAPAQTTAPAAGPAPGTEKEEEVLVLSPFEVTADDNESYSAATTLAGNRLNTELRDVGNAIQVITAQFLKDTGAVNNETLLQYTTGTEVGNIYGNFTGLGDGAQLNETSRFTNPNQNTRVRGLTQADNTRDYFLSDIPWDGYNIDRVDLSRGPNSILFGQGSPAGIINAGSKTASFRNAGEVEFRYGTAGSARATLDYNRMLIKDQLAVRVNALYDAQKYQQKPAFQDDRRIAGALRWEPGFLKKGSARTIVKANFEKGDIKSNRPRTLPPGDQITPWFYTGTYTGRYSASGTLINGTAVTAGAPRVFQNLNKMTTNPHTAQNDNFYRPDFPHGLTRPAIAGGPMVGRVNPYYNPWAGSFGASIGGPVAYYSNGAGSTPVFINQEIREDWGISSTGALDNSLAYDFNRLVGISPYSNFAQNAGLPMAEFGIYKNNSLKDSSIFNFYDNLLDGPNKNEWQDFDVYNISVSQTFFDEKLGFDATYNRQDYKNGQLSLLTDWRQAIYIDINRVHEDGTIPGKNGVPYDDGTPNPNLGRPFISDNGQNGNNSFDSQRQSRRFTGFFTHDFSRGDRQNVFTRMLGKHTITGLWAKDEQKTDRREWMRWAVTDPAYRAFIRSTANFDEGQTFVPSQVIYLGPSLLSASSAAGANIARPDATTSLLSGTTRVFDSHWAFLPGVDPAAPWQNTFYPSDNGTGYNSTQSENPANYVGWRNMPLNITDSETSAANRDLLTRRATIERKLTTSKVAVWQAHMFEGGLVGTYGIRKDRAQGWIRSLNTNSGNNEDGIAQKREFGYLRIAEALYLPKKGSDLSETSKSWSLVAHFDELPGFRNWTAEWPVRVSAFYSTSENFQPEALRVNIYGEQLPLPKGTTKDMGLLLETKDGKYSLRINKFQTDVTNGTSSALNRAGFIGTALARGTNWANQFEYDWGLGNQPSNHHMLSQVRDRPANSPQPAGWTGVAPPASNPVFDPTNSLYNFGTDVGETQAMADAREKAAIAGWRAFQNSVDPRFWAAWSIDLQAPFRSANPTGLNSSTPNGFAVTEDSTSEGYEIEFSAQPIRNWRLTFNAAKVEARRTNIGGKELTDFIAAYEKAIQTTAAGDIRIWWGTAANDTTLRQWYSGGEGLGGEWASRRLQEGTNVPELREWRFNAITNYDITEGRFKGLSVGGGLRWQSDVVVGYKPVQGSNPRALSFDLVNPYMGPAETNVDFWVGYGRRINNKLSWRVQLNVRNAFAGDDLIPITVQPDGTAATYRIAPPQTWSISNTFKF